MYCRKLLGGFLAGVTAVGVAGLHLVPAWAEDRMQLRASTRKSAEFQSQVGDRVFFSDASAELGSRGRLALEAQAAWLARHPALTVIIEGHADDAGAAHHNLEISQRRAETVRRRLIEMGVTPERISVVAYGRAMPIAECAAPACTAQNRRAVTVIGPLFDTAEAAGEPRSPPARRSPRRLN